MKLLFICSRNQWRSPTAEAIWRRVDGVDARSAGVSRFAKRRVKASDIAWADVIFVMEDAHKTRLRQMFRNDLSRKTVHVLDIPDDYAFMSSELIEILEAKVASLIDG